MPDQLGSTCQALADSAARITAGLQDGNLNSFERELREREQHIARLLRLSESGVLGRGLVQAIAEVLDSGQALAVSISDECQRTRDELELTRRGRRALHSYGSNCARPDSRFLDRCL